MVCLKGPGVVRKVPEQCLDDVLLQAHSTSDFFKTRSMIRNVSVS
jgi:hypothetical protein